MRIFGSAIPSEEEPSSNALFADVDQLYCNGSCGAWDSAHHCGQGDANEFCKLKTGNLESTATTYQVATAIAAPGICCPTIPNLGDCTDTGVVTESGLAVQVTSTSLSSSHGAGSVITGVSCT